MNIKALLLITSAIFISACSPYIVSANPNHSASKSDEKAEKIKSRHQHGEREEIENAFFKKKKLGG